MHVCPNHFSHFSHYGKLKRNENEPSLVKEIITSCQREIDRVNPGQAEGGLGAEKARPERGEPEGRDNMPRVASAGVAANVLGSGRGIIRPPKQIKVKEEHFVQQIIWFNLIDIFLFRNVSVAPTGPRLF